MNKPKKWIPIVVACVLILIICAGSLAGNWIQSLNGNQEQVDLYAYYQVEGDQGAVYLDQTLTAEKAILRDGEAYLSYSFVFDTLNERIYIDDSVDQLLYVLPDRVLSVPEGSRFGECEGLGNGNGENACVWFRNDTIPYISVNVIMQFTDISVRVFENPGRVMITPGTRSLNQALVSKDTQLREASTKDGRIVTQVTRGETVEILTEMDRWTEVLTEEGHIGYIRDNCLEKKETLEIVSDFEPLNYPSLTMEEPVCLVWHQVFSKKGNEKLSELLSKTKGVNVVSPTWFSMTDNEGNFFSLADESYVKEAHERGIQVWGLIDNFAEEVSTFETLSRMESRQRLIQNLMREALAYDLDGINIDFEGMAKATGIHFIQFIRELSLECRREGLVLSVDNYTPVSGTGFYRWKEQGIVADYVIIMCYDEHTGKNLPAGSNSSLPFVIRGIEDMLKYVPANKLIAAFPFYNKDWMFDAEKIIGDNEDPLSREFVIKIENPKMETAINQLKENGAELVWLEELGQYYGEYEQDKVIHRIWLEDVNSLKKKMDAAGSYDLAGVAFWKLGMETEDCWDMIASALQP